MGALGRQRYLVSNTGIAIVYRLWIKSIPLQGLDQSPGGSALQMFFRNTSHNVIKMFYFHPTAVFMSTMVLLGDYKTPVTRMAGRPSGNGQIIERRGWRTA